MKNNIVYSILLVLVFSSSAFSQFGIKAGFALGEPLDDNLSNTHLGFDAGITYEITEKIRAEVLFEFLTWQDENSFTLPFLGTITTKTKSNIMPITVGVDYKFLTDKIQPYAGLNLGSYRFKSRLETIGGVFEDTRSYFGLFPKLGVSLELTENILIDANVKYHVAFDKNDKVNASNNQGFQNQNVPQNTSQSNTTIFGANIGVIYKFN